MPPVLATVNWAWVIARHVVRVMVVGETDRIGGTGVAVGMGVGDPPAEGEVVGIAVLLGLGVAVDVCGTLEVEPADVPLTGDAPPEALPPEELDDACDDAKALDDVKGARTIERVPREARA